MSSHGEGSKTHARLRADREHAVSSSAAIAPRRVPGRDEDDRPRGRVDLVVAERERRAAAQDDVHLLVAVRRSECSSTTRWPAFSAV